MIRLSSNRVYGQFLREMAVFFAVLCFLVATISAHSQTVKPVITVVQSEESSAARLQMLPEREQNLMARMPANSYHFGKFSAGDFVGPHNLTLEFSIATRVTKISSTPDFKIMPGGTCLEGMFYMAGGRCELLVEFTPQGAGRRVGNIAISHTASPQAANVLMAGFAEFPVVSFIPSLIGTPSEFVSGGQGVFNNAQNIAIAITATICMWQIPETTASFWSIPAPRSRIWRLRPQTEFQLP